MRCQVEDTEQAVVREAEKLVDLVRDGLAYPELQIAADRLRQALLDHDRRKLFLQTKASPP